MSKLYKNLTLDEFIDARREYDMGNELTFNRTQYKDLFLENYLFGIYDDKDKDDYPIVKSLLNAEMRKMIKEAIDL